MNVPRHIRPLSNEFDENFVPSFGNGSITNGGDAQNTRDRMIVPDRIIVAGGNETVADKPTPPEIALDLQAFAPGRYTQNSLLETPPDKLTLHNRAFPAVDESEFYRQQRRMQQNSVVEESKSTSLGVEKDSERQIPTEKVNQSTDSLPPTSTMSLLSPSEELVLLRNHVRKLTTRLQKLEEEVQETNRHVNIMEIIGGIFVVITIAKSMKQLFFTPLGS